MSLIQEALKRQQNDMNDNEGVQNSDAKPDTPPPSPQDPPKIARKISANTDSADLDSSAPPPVQEPPQLEEDEPPPLPPEEESAASESGDTDTPPAPPAADNKAGMKVALIVLGAVLCLVLGVWAITFAVKSFRSKPPAVDQSEESLKTTDPAAGQQPESTPQNTPPEPVPVVESAGAAPSTETVNVSPQESAPVEEHVQWPILMVTGLVGKGAQGAVMFDTEIVGVGETIDGVRVVGITQKGAELEYKGQKKLVKAGGSTVVQ